MDGQNERQLNAGDRGDDSPQPAFHSVGAFDGNLFFETLRHKLHWSGSNIPGSSLAQYSATRWFA